MRSDEVWLNDVAGRGGADFRFRVGGSQFVVEVTNISIKTATSESGLPHVERHSGSYGLLTSAIRSKVRGKFRQAARAGNIPVLICVSTLHWHASISCMRRHAVEAAMTSTPMFTTDIDMRTGEAVGDSYQSTDLEQSTFLSPRLLLNANGHPIPSASYQPISGFILAGFGIPPQANVYGALNPSAVSPFDPVSLPDISFCRFEPWPPTGGSLHLTWTQTEEQEKAREEEARMRRIFRDPEARQQWLKMSEHLSRRRERQAAQSADDLIFSGNEEE